MSFPNYHNIFNLDYLQSMYDYYKNVKAPGLTKSKTEQRCLTPCYRSKTHIRHPETFQIITDPKKTFCATPGWFDYVDKQWKYTDECYKPTRNVYLSWYNTNVGNYIPLTARECKSWLKRFHKIEKYSDIKRWMDNPKVDPVTKSRIKACAEVAFMTKEDMFKDTSESVMIEYFYRRAQDNWIKLYVPDLLKIMEVQPNGFVLITMEKKGISSFTQEEEIKRITDYVKMKFLSKVFVKINLSKFVEYEKTEWRKLKDQEDKVRDFLKHQLILSIKRTGKII